MAARVVVRGGTGVAAIRRLAFALFTSAAMHAFLFIAHPGGPASRADALAAWHAMSVRIAPTGPRNAEERAQAPAAQSRMRSKGEEQAGESRHALRHLPPERPEKPTPPPRPGAVSSAGQDSPRLPSPSDTTWYTAHDIDSYPKSPLPLLLVPPAGLPDAPARLLFWVRIDEHGEVIEVRAGEPGMSAAWVEAARASLATVRFTPARKDDRAVRSRLLFSVSFSDAGTRDAGTRD